MPIKFKRAYLEEIRFRYRNSKKKDKGKILDEFCGVCNLTRKHAIKILRGSLNPRTHRPGPKSKYQREDVIYKRLLENSYISENEKSKLKDTFNTKNPIYLKKELDKKLKEFLKLVDEIKIRNRSTGS